MTQLLELVDIHSYYGNSYVLQGMSLKVEEGFIVSLLGRNGMGKTTTIRAIMGLTPPRRGVIRFREKEITGLHPTRIARMGLALVPQGRRIFPSLTVKENLYVGERKRGRLEDWSLEKVFALFPILKMRAKFKGNLLSGGEQQMLCIGRCLMTNPDLLLMDEPSEGLAPLIVQELGTTTKQLQSGGLSILLVEQNLSLALEISDYVYIVDKGMIGHHCAPEELRRDKETMLKYLGASA
jgi:branched-chain amino acid transport system ATP-binding protein